MTNRFLQMPESTPQLDTKMTTWKPSNGVMTLFPAAPTSTPPPSPLELYSRVWGAEPERFQKQPNPLMPAVAQGKRGGFVVTCAVQPGRIDLRLTPPAPVRQGIGVPFPLIENTPQFQAELMRIMDVVGSSILSDSVIRLALNLHFLALEPSLQAANAALTSIIPPEYRLRLSNEEDFVLQINLPYTSSEAANIRMNFLTKWSVDRFQILAIPVGGFGVMPTPTVRFASAVAFDINSVPDSQGTPLSGNQQSSLLREALIAVTREQKGIGLNVDKL
jgi:hypothetical protein